MEHFLKVTKDEYQAAISGEKTFELTKMDRVYSIGDRLILVETAEGKETGNNVVVRVTYIQHSTPGIDPKWCILGVKRSGKQGRTNSGNRPKNIEEALEYGQKIGKTHQAVSNFFDYYTQTGWKMKSGLPIADWKAALRNWKDYGNKPANISSEELAELEIVLPMLVQRTGELSANCRTINFRDPAFGALIKYYGLERCRLPFNSYDVKGMVKHYNTLKLMHAEVKKLQGSSLTEREVTCPTIPEYIEILQKRSKA